MRYYRVTGVQTCALPIPHGAVQSRRDHVERIFHERPIDRGAAAVAYMHTDPGADVRSDAVGLRKDELEIDVADEVAERDAAQIDAIVHGWIHDAIEAPLKPVACLLIELRMEVRQTQQESHAGRDAAIIDAQSAHRRPGEVRRSENAGVELDAGEAEIVVGKLVQDTLGG